MAAKQASAQAHEALKEQARLESVRLHQREQEESQRQHRILLQQSGLSAEPTSTPAPQAPGVSPAESIPDVATSRDEGWNEKSFPLEGGSGGVASGDEREQEEAAQRAPTEAHIIDAGMRVLFPNLSFLLDGKAHDQVQRASLVYQTAHGFGLCSGAGRA